VIFETVFTLERTYKQSKEAIRNTFLPLIELPGIVLPGKCHLRKANLRLQRQDRRVGDIDHDLSRPGA